MSGEIIMPLDWRGSKVTLQHGVPTNREIIVDIFCKSSVYGLNGDHSDQSIQCSRRVVIFEVLIRHLLVQKCII